MAPRHKSWEAKGAGVALLVLGTGFFAMIGFFTTLHWFWVQIGPINTFGAIAVISLLLYVVIHLLNLEARDAEH